MSCSYRQFDYGPRGPVWLSGKVFDWWSRGPGFESLWILRVFHGSVLRQDTSEPQPSAGETQERQEWCELSAWYNWNTVESGVKHYSVNQSTTVGQCRLTWVVDTLFKLVPKSLDHTIPTFNDPKNIVGKGGNAGKQHFLLLPQCFQPFLCQILFL